MQKQILYIISEHLALGLSSLVLIYIHTHTHTHTHSYETNSYLPLLRKKFEIKGPFPHQRAFFSKSLTLAQAIMEENWKQGEHASVTS